MCWEADGVESANSLAELAKGNVTVPRGKGKAAERSESTNGEESMVSRKRNLEEEELALQKREESIEKEKRKYALPRTNPMGCDRFHNKYYYFDEVGMVVNERYGAGRILIQSPSSRELADILTEAGRQKYNKRRKIEENFGTEEAQWGYYEDPEQVDDLLKWFNEKGRREVTLKREIISRLSEIKSGMVKRMQDLIASRKSAEVRRSRRTQATKALLSQQNYMKWVNKLAK